MSFEKALHFVIFDLQERFWEQCIFKYLRAEPEDHYFLLVSKIHYSVVFRAVFCAVFVLLGGLCGLQMQHIILIYMYAKIINFISDLSCQLCPDNSFTWPWLQRKFPCELNKDINYYFTLLLINHFLLFVDWTSFKHSWKQRIHSR